MKISACVKKFVLILAVAQLVIVAFLQLGRSTGHSQKQEVLEQVYRDTAKIEFHMAKVEDKLTTKLLSDAEPTSGTRSRIQTAGFSPHFTDASFQSPHLTDASFQISISTNDTLMTTNFNQRGRYVDVNTLVLSYLTIDDSNSDNEEKCVSAFKEQFTNYCEKLTVVLENAKQNAGLTETINLPYCSCFPDTLQGRQKVKLKFEDRFEAAEKMLAEQGVLAGGHWAPQNCRARQRVAIVIPFRARTRHLQALLRNLHPQLQRQQIDYTIFVIEQREPRIFNKGMLMNVGFREIILRYGTFDCFVFNDVDMIPEDDRNIYTCHKIPRHVGAYVNKFKYQLCCGVIFGGATAFTGRQFIKVNGFSNEYYGWGGEDDDMMLRVVSQDLNITRYPSCVSRYTMISHKPDKRNPRNPGRKIAYELRPEHYKRVGLNSLTYDVVDHKRLPLYTWIFIDLPANITLPDNSTVPRFEKLTGGQLVRVA